MVQSHSHKSSEEQSSNGKLGLLTAKPGPFHYTAVALNFFNHYFKIKSFGFQVRAVKIIIKEVRWNSLLAASQI